MTPKPVSELIAGASFRAPARPSDGKSTSTFERLNINGQRYFLKRNSPSTDWLMRAMGDHVHRPYIVWQAGIMDRVPNCIDHTVVAMEVEGTGEEAVLSTLMRDVGEHFIPEGGAVVGKDKHERFVDHLAQLCAEFWDFEDPTGGLLTSMAERLRFFEASFVAREMAIDQPPGTIVVADAGWRALPERSPLLHDLAVTVWEQPELLTRPLADTPWTFLQGDWKMGNLGMHPGGRTILVDWAYPGAGPPCWDFCWYLALNQARLPESKEATIARFRGDLERHGIDTGEWFDTQLDLCMAGIMVTFAWEKAHDSDSELRWWENRVAEALSRQGLNLARSRS